MRVSCPVPRQVRHVDSLAPLATPLPLQAEHVSRRGKVTLLVAPRAASRNDSEMDTYGTG